MPNEIDAFLAGLKGTANDLQTAISSVDSIIKGANQTAATVSGIANNGINLPVNIGLDPQTKNMVLLGAALIAILLIWAIFFK